MWIEQVGLRLVQLDCQRLDLLRKAYKLIERSCCLNEVAVDLRHLADDAEAACGSRIACSCSACLASFIAMRLDLAEGFAYGCDVFSCGLELKKAVSCGLELVFSSGFELGRQG